MLSISPSGPVVGFLPMQYMVYDPEHLVRPGPKIHLAEELRFEQEPLPVVVRETGKWHKPGHHLDFVFMMPRPFDAKMVQGRHRLIHFPGDQTHSGGLEENALEKLKKRIAREERTYLHLNPEVSSDPALWMEALRRIPPIMEKNPGLIGKIWWEGGEIEAGPLLKLRRGGMYQQAEAAAVEASSLQAEESYRHFVEQVRQTGS